MQRLHFHIMHKTLTQSVPDIFYLIHLLVQTNIRVAGLHFQQMIHSFNNFNTFLYVHSEIQSTSRLHLLSQISNPRDTIIRMTRNGRIAFKSSLCHIREQMSLQNRLFLSFPPLQSVQTIFPFLVFIMLFSHGFVDCFNIFPGQSMGCSISLHSALPGWEIISLSSVTHLICFQYSSTKPALKYSCFCKEITFRNRQIF